MTDTGSLSVPAFFASISSLKTTYSIRQYLNVILASGYREFLVSAYDLEQLRDADKESVRVTLSDALNRGCIVALDSGNYESFWLRDSTWSQSRFHAVLRTFPCSLAFSFDVQDSVDQADVSSNVIRSLEIDREAADGIPIVPIVHGTPDTISSTLETVAMKSGCKMIAVPERDLGGGIRQRLNTLRRVRERLDQLSVKPLLHLLGTGNPLSIALYTFTGAHSFDGLEWCQTSVNSQDGSLHHLSHGELFLPEQRFLGEKLSAGAATLLNNLSFYLQWIKDLRATSLGEPVTSHPSNALIARARGVLQT